MTTGYINLPLTAGGIPIYASATLFPITATDGDQAVAADTNTIYIYDTSVPGWQPVATASPSVGITALLGDVTATGPGAVTSTVNFVGTASTADVVQSVADTQGAVSDPIAVNTLAKRDGSGRCDFSEIQMYHATGGPTSLPSSFIDFTELDFYGASGEQARITPTFININDSIGSVNITSGGQITTQINLQAPTDSRDYSFQRTITSQAGVTTTLTLDKSTITSGDLSGFYGNQLNLNVANVTSDFENALIYNTVQGTISGYLSNAEIYNNCQILDSGAYNYYVSTIAQTINGVYWPLWFGGSFVDLNSNYAGLTLATSATNMIGSGAGVKHSLTVSNYQGSNVTGFSETSSITSATPGSFDYLGLKVQPTLVNANNVSGIKVDMSGAQGSNVLAVDATGADIYVRDGQVYSEIFNTSTSPARVTNFKSDMNIDAGLTFSGPSRQVDLNLTAGAGSVMGGIITLDSSTAFADTNALWNLYFANSGVNVYNNIKNLEFANSSTTISAIDNILITNSHTTASANIQPLNVTTNVGNASGPIIHSSMLTNAGVASASAAFGYYNKFALGNAQGTPAYGFLEVSEIASLTTQGSYYGFLATPTLNNLSSAVGSRMGMNVVNPNATSVVGFLENSSISGGPNSSSYSGLKVYPSITGGNRVRGIEVNMTTSTASNLRAMEIIGDSDITGVLTVTGNTNIQSGELSVQTAGRGLSIKQGSNAKIGVTGAFPGGGTNTVTVTNTSVTSNSIVFISVVSGATTIDPKLWVSTITPGASFVISAGDNSFTGTVGWMIVERIP